MIQSEIRDESVHLNQVAFQVSRAVQDFTKGLFSQYFEYLSYDAIAYLIVKESTALVGDAIANERAGELLRRVMMTED